MPCAFLRALFKVFVLGWYCRVVMSFPRYASQNFLNSLDVNCVPLSVTTQSTTLKSANSSCRNPIVQLVVGILHFRTSDHLVWLSTTMRSKGLRSRRGSFTKWADEQHWQAGFESRLLPDLPLPFIPTLIGLRAFDLVCLVGGSDKYYGWFRFWPRFTRSCWRFSCECASLHESTMFAMSLSMFG